MDYAIEISNLSKTYPGFALQDVSFNLPCGSILGFVGENGAGKTTTIKAVLDVIKPTSGSIRLFGQNHITAGPAARQNIGVVFDESNFHDLLNTRQIGRVMAGLHPTWDSAYYTRLLHRFGLDGSAAAKKNIKDFSRGMKMKLSLATALAHRPRLLILDEATSGLDPIIRDEILELFLEFIQDEDHSILFSSHITSDVKKAADYVVFIHGGKVVLNAEKDELFTRYAIVRCNAAQYQQLDPQHVIGSRKTDFGIEALVDNRPDLKLQEGMVIDPAKLDDIMLYTIRGCAQ